MGLDQITPAWMSEVLGGDVRDVRSERIGDGLVGLNLRVSIDAADSSGAGLPESVVVKLPSLDETSRATGIALRNYEREVKFYDEIASTVDIRVPACHHATWDEVSGDFVLVLEDMSPAQTGDQITGCGIDQARTAVTELARLHGPRWNDESLLDHEFLTRRTGPEDAAQLVSLWTMFLPGFLETYEQYLPASGANLVQAFGPRLADWIEGRTGPVSVVHGDYRLDNLLFATAAGGPPVTAVDWQTPGHGAPVSDLAYFCGAGLLPDDRREHEATLLDDYAAALSEYGLNIERDWLEGEYRRDAFGGVIMSVIASQVVGGTERSESMFAAMASRHVQHCIDLDSIDAIG